MISNYNIFNEIAPNFVEMFMLNISFLRICINISKMKKKFM